ncbi:hypothetical protein CLAVI_000003 [Candidatus Clavichlamydia salmonicola]|uniref:hypothetical protein n=1 Tax=Candidatus Clavichlamydia salmonicola TaxID=469812 RepID=UPI0018911968|nr:hypothetical protein [Candidatus Clavichlamydia salmonicola]MBF5050402.1 hypothetical protein [Candidatus Clavichlamydia salmonicola]
MDSIIIFFGKHVPSNPQDAFSNFKRNLGNLYQRVRLVVSCVLGVYGLDMASGCYSKSCGDKVATFSSGVSTKCTLDPLRTACLVAGVFYGVGSAVYLGLVLANNITILLKKKRYCYPYTSTRQELLCNVPIIVAGSLGAAYGLIYMPACMLIGVENTGQSTARWCKVAHALGATSGVMYFVDVGVICFDMLFQNLVIDDDSVDDQEREAVMLPALQEACADMQVDIMP